MTISYIHANYYYTFIQLIFIIKFKKTAAASSNCVGRERLRARMMMTRRLGNQQEVACCCLPLFQLLFRRGAEDAGETAAATATATRTQCSVYIQSFSYKCSSCNVVVVVVVDGETVINDTPATAVSSRFLLFGCCILLHFLRATDILNVEVE